MVRTETNWLKGRRLRSKRCWIARAAFAADELVSISNGKSGDAQQRFRPSPVALFRSLWRLSIKCSPGHSSSLLLPLLSASLLSASFLLCLATCLPEIGGRLSSLFKNRFFVCVLFLPLWCSGLRWVASGCPSARPIKTDSSCRCLKTVADRVTQQFTAISGEKSVCPYGHRVELFLISECERNDSLVSVFQGSSTPTVAKRFWFLSSFFGQSKWIFYITNHHRIQRLQSQQFEQSVLQPKWRQKTSLLLHWIFKK